MNILIIFLIIFLSLAGMATIWYITSRAKCGVDGTTDYKCPLNQYPYCPTPDATVACGIDSVACGPIPDDFTSLKCGSIPCQYDSASSSYKWACIGTPSGNSGNLGTACTLDSNNLNYGTVTFDSKGNAQITTNKTPTLNYKTYNQLDLGSGNIGCQLSACNSPYKVSKQDGTCGGGSCPTDDIYIYDASCKATGCTDNVNYTWNASNLSCTPDCAKPAMVNKYLFNNVTPSSQGTFNYTAENFIDTGAAAISDKYICIPKRATNTTDYYGGCGDINNTLYALNIKFDAGVATKCSETLNGQSSKWSEGGGSTTRGCIECAVSGCPAWATSPGDCLNPVEQDCYFRSGVDTTGKYVNAVQACTISSADNLSVWEIFGPYNASGCVDGTFGTVGCSPAVLGPFTLNFQRADFSDAGTGIVVSYYDYTLGVPSGYLTHVDNNLALPNFGPDQSSIISGSNMLQISFSDNLDPTSLNYDPDTTYTIIAQDLYNTIVNNYLTADRQGDNSITIVLHSHRSGDGDGVTNHVGVSSIISGSKTFRQPFQPPLDFGNA